MNQFLIVLLALFNFTAHSQDCEFPYSKEWNEYVENKCIKEHGYFSYIFKKDDQKIKDCKQGKYHSKKVWYEFLDSVGVVDKSYHWITVNTEGDLTFNDNNCYNYATQLNTRTFAQPGRSSQEEQRNIDLKNECNASFHNATKEQKFCQPYVCGAVADGLKRVESIDECRTSDVKVALSTTDHNRIKDYHWYRLDKENYWTHKIGNSKPSELDESGDYIHDPETADRGEYKYFCGYFCVDHNKVKIE